MASSDFKKKLKASAAMYKAAVKKVEENRGKGGAPEFDDGRYIAKLVSAEVGEWKEKLKVLFKWKFVDGPYDGQEYYDFQGIGTEDNLYYFGRRIEDLGWELPDSPEEIPDLLTQIVESKAICKIRLRTKGEFQNCYLEKVYGEDEDPSDDEDVTGADEADESDDAEDTPPPAKKKGKKAAEPEPAPAKKGKKAAPPVEEEDDEDEDDEDEDDEDESDDADEEADDEEDDEADEDETEEGDVELQVGMTVECDTQKGKKKGKVTEILAAEGKARVTLDDGSKIRIALDKIAFDEAPEEEPAPAPKKKAKKR